MKKGRRRCRSKSKNSCNGCRVLRKGCGDNCVLRSCMAWIDSAEAQSHATLFLSKFFGRAGLLRLISSCPPHLRPQAFVSLLYEACGRSVSPVYGCTGLYLSGNSHVCEFAVNTVVNGLGSSLMLSRENSSKPVSVSVSSVCRDEQNSESEWAHEEGSNHEENEGAELDLSLGMTCNLSRRTNSTSNNTCS